MDFQALFYGQNPSSPPRLTASFPHIRRRICKQNRQDSNTICTEIQIPKNIFVYSFSSNTDGAASPCLFRDSVLCWVQSISGKEGLTDEIFLFQLLENRVHFAVALVACLPLLPAIKAFCGRFKVQIGRGWLGAPLGVVRDCVLLVVLVLALAALAKGSYNPFIYFNF